MCGAVAHVRFVPKADICVHGSNFGRYGGEHVVGRHGTADAFERKIANGFDGHGVFDRHQDPRTNQDLPGLGFVAESRGDVRYRSNGGIIETSLKANGTERRKSMRDTDAEAEAHVPADAISQSTLQSPYAYQAPSAPPAVRDLGQEWGH